MKYLKRQVVMLFIVISMILSTGITFAYWASSVVGNNDTATAVVGVSDWGIPIFNAQEFYDFATKTDSVATDLYYLHNDIDFTGFSWVYNTATDDVTFRGTLNGNGKKLMNLTITNTSTTFLYNGIFPRGFGATIRDLTLENVNTVTTLSGTTQRSGLLFGDVYGGTTTIFNVKVINSGSQGNSQNGVGGLVGNVVNGTTILNISQVKATNLKVFNDTSYVGGLVGRISTAGATVNVTDVDFEGDIFANIVSTNGNSYAGGIIGYLVTGTKFTLTRAMIEATFQNTLVTAQNFNVYSNKYLGGVIGYNNTALANTNLNTLFFTGSLYTRIDARRNDVGSISGYDRTQATVSNVFQGYVAYRNTGGSVIYTTTTQTGQNAVRVSTTALPTLSWWNTYYALLSPGNSAWQQDGTGRPYLAI